MFNPIRTRGRLLHGRFSTGILRKLSTSHESATGSVCHTSTSGEFPGKIRPLLLRGPLSKGPYLRVGSASSRQASELFGDFQTQNQHVHRPPTMDDCECLERLCLISHLRSQRRCLVVVLHCVIFNAA